MDEASQYIGRCALDIVTIDHLAAQGIDTERELNALINETTGDAIKRYQWITARALDASGPARSQFDRPTAVSRLV